MSVSKFKEGNLSLIDKVDSLQLAIQGKLFNRNNLNNNDYY